MLGACVLAALIHRHPEHLKAPEWIALLAAGIFGLAGLCMTAQALGRRVWARWLACVLLCAMAVVPSWIALGSGPRQCMLVSPGGPSAMAEIVCRGVFGAGALVLAALVVVAVRGALGRQPAAQPSTDADAPSPHPVAPREDHP